MVLLDELLTLMRAGAPAGQPPPALVTEDVESQHASTVANPPLPVTVSIDPYRWEASTLAPYDWHTDASTTHDEPRACKSCHET